VNERTASTAACFRRISACESGTSSTRFLYASALAYQNQLQTLLPPQLRQPRLSLWISDLVFFSASSPHTQNPTTKYLQMRHDNFVEQLASFAP
jgi:hypothetical protein